MSLNRDEVNLLCGLRGKKKVTLYGNMCYLCVL
jgi:hypothetical protein